MFPINPDSDRYFNVKKVKQNRIRLMHFYQQVNVYRMVCGNGYAGVGMRLME